MDIPRSPPSLPHQPPGLSERVSSVTAALRTGRMIDCRCGCFFRMKTRRGLQTQMMACCKFHAMMPVTPGKYRRSPCRERLLEFILCLSVTIAVPTEIQYMTSVIMSILDKLDPMERQYLRPIITVV
jgi:hypothetical protein